MSEKIENIANPNNESNHLEKIYKIAFLFIVFSTLIIFSVIFLYLNKDTSKSNTSVISSSTTATTTSLISTYITTSNHTIESTINNSNSSTSSTTTSFIYDYKLPEKHVQDYEKYESQYLSAYIKKGYKFSIPEKEYKNKDIYSNIIDYEGIAYASINNDEATLEFSINDPEKKMIRAACRNIHNENEVMIDFQDKLIRYKYYEEECVEGKTPTKEGYIKFINKQIKYIDVLGGLVSMELEDNSRLLIPLNGDKISFDQNKNFMFKDETAYFLILEILKIENKGNEDIKNTFILHFKLQNKHNLLGGNGVLTRYFGDKEYYVFKPQIEGNDALIDIRLKMPRSKLDELENVLIPFHIFLDSSRRKK